MSNRTEFTPGPTACVVVAQEQDEVGKPLLVISGRATEQGTAVIWGKKCGVGIAARRPRSNWPERDRKVPIEEPKTLFFQGRVRKRRGRLAAWDEYGTAMGGFNDEGRKNSWCA